MGKRGRARVTQLHRCGGCLTGGLVRNHSEPHGAARVLQAHQAVPGDVQAPSDRRHGIGGRGHRCKKTTGTRNGRDCTERKRRRMPDAGDKTRWAVRGRPTVTMRDGSIPAGTANPATLSLTPDSPVVPVVAVPLQVAVVSSNVQPCEAKLLQVTSSAYVAQSTAAEPPPAAPVQVKLS